MNTETLPTGDIAKEPISVDAYRKKVGAEKSIVIPSGATFILRRVTPMEFVQEGLTDIPNDFFKFIVELGRPKIDFDEKANKKNIELFEKFMAIAVEKGVVSPPCLTKYDEAKMETHLIFQELENNDQKFIINFITGVPS